MLHVERTQLLDRSIYDFVDAENRAIFERNVALRASGQASSYEISLTRSDGRQVHCLNNATPLFDAAGMRTEQHFATSADGTRVPYFVVFPAGAAEGDEREVARVVTAVQ